MKRLLLLAGAAALVGAPPAFAEAGPKGKPHAIKVQKVKVQKVKPLKARPLTVPVRNWATVCPPGLVPRGTVCLPPGHANRLLAVGTRVPRGWTYTPWGAVPTDLRTRYNLDPSGRYIYRDNVIYVVDPQTQLISSIINAVL